MPNMYESVGYETYGESDAFANGVEAAVTCRRNNSKRIYALLIYENTNEGYELAKAELKKSFRFNSS